MRHLTSFFNSNKNLYYYLYVYLHSNKGKVLSPLLQSGPSLGPDLFTVETWLSLKNTHHLVQGKVSGS